MERFHIYLYGLTFTVVTDCNALVYAVTKANLNPRIARWTLSLQNYSFKLIHRPGNKMSHVDALSRQIGYVDTLPIERELEFRQLQDKELYNIANKLEFTEDPKFELIDGLVYKKDNNQSRFVVPETMVNSIIRAYHDDLAHCGLEKTFESIHESYWFPSMRKRIKDYINNCITCLMANASPHSYEGEMQVVEGPKLLFETIHMDHFGPLQQTEENFKICTKNNRRV